ncbi:GNAT family N-acetyltransferase [Saccharothrix syringae]|uniref:N-acetyltransferase n=1 Tax=Saccharothrix syringae TaxID=103733 RepID=A0A5Q0GTN5_SACSY|nr:GNAT family N-acetyltransferase [Saccharothrix syringae]QFZ16732.1 N-acetyltransferase [Saccharothrix syringae]
MPLETDRLTLRPFTWSDVDLLVWLLGEPRVMRYIEDGRPVPRERVEREVLPKVVGGTGWWAAHEKAAGAFVGWFELSPAGDGVAELGYRLHPDHWGRGYATEGASALVAAGFAAGLTRVVATAMAVNTASRRVLEKVGLRYVRTFHEDWPDPIEGWEHGDVEYALER